MAAERAIAAKDIFFLGGFMTLPKPELPEGYEVYYSQYGLQYQLITVIPRFFPVPLSLWFNIVKGINVLLVGAVFGWIAAWSARSQGVWGWMTFTALTLGSTIVILIAPNLYWIAWLLFLPLAFSLNLYPAMSSPRRWPIFLFGISFIILVKSLCGYEYLTCLTLSAALPVIFYSLLEGRSLFFMIRRAIMVGVAAMVGFAGAIGLHLWQLSGTKGMEAFIKRININIGTINQPSDATERVAYLIRRFFIFLFDNNMLQMSMVTVLLFLALRYAKLNFSLLERKAWTAALALGVVASMSWNCIALGHMSGHPHLNGITFYLGWYPMAFLLIAEIVGKATAQNCEVHACDSAKQII